jgi:hypothetical protein
MNPTVFGGVSSGVLSPAPPEDQALFGYPPLLRGEDIGLYNELMGQFAKIVEPKDLIEWWWVKDITDHSWEIRRTAPLQGPLY